MKIFFIILSICIAGTYSSILEPEHKEELRRIRNRCIVEAKLSPSEISSLIRATRPAEKLIDTSKCIVNKLIVSQKDNKVVSEIIDRTKLAIQNSDLSKVVDDVISNCQNLLGTAACDKVLDLIGLLIETVQKLKN